MSIQEHLSKIRNAVYGREVRESIAKGIETAYDDASENGNANMEVRLARGANPNLNTRLNKMDDTDRQTTAQLAQTHKKNEQSIAWRHIAQDARDVITGTTQPAYVGRDSVGSENIINHSVTGRQLDDVTIASQSVNIFDKNAVIYGGYFQSTENGAWQEDDTQVSSEFIPITEKVNYRRSSTGVSCFWDKDKNFLATGGRTHYLDAPEGAKYVTIAVQTHTLDETMITEATVYPASYVPFIPTYNLGESWNIDNVDFDIKNQGLRGQVIDGVLKGSKTINLFDKNDVIDGGYFESTRNGEWRKNPDYVSSALIPVAPNVRYRRLHGGNSTFWDADGNFLSGGGGAFYLTPPENARYVRLAVHKDHLDTQQFTISAQWSDTYVPYRTHYYFDDKWNVSGHSTVQSSDTFLRVPTPYNDGTNDPWANHQSTHPSVVQFDEKWNGFKYWMVHTPYPYENNQLENPCIAASNDGIKWEEPSGISNPLVTAPATGYNSDGHIFYNETTNTLEMWYREAVLAESPKREIIKRMTSSNGSTWSAPEEMVSVTSPEHRPEGMIFIVSPSVMFHENKYKMWFTQEQEVYYMESATGKDWGEPIQVLSNGSPIYSWHISVTLHEGKYHMLNLYSSNSTIYYSTATIGNETSFGTQTTVIERGVNDWDVDGRILYRATPIFTSRGVMVIYGTVDSNNVWLLHVQTGKDFNSLEPITSRAFRFYGIE